MLRKGLWDAPFDAHRYLLSTYYVLDSEPKKIPCGDDLVLKTRVPFFGTAFEALQVLAPAEACALWPASLK